MADNFMSITYKKFDLVKILTTKNVKWMSADDPSKVSPYGDWSVVNALDDGYLMICKDTNMVCIPNSDVKLSNSYDLSQAFKALENIKNVRTKEEGPRNISTSPQKD